MHHHMLWFYKRKTAAYGGLKARFGFVAVFRAGNEEGIGGIIYFHFDRQTVKHLSIPGKSLQKS